MKLIPAVAIALAAIVLAAPCRAAQDEKPPSIQDLIRELKTGTPYERASAAVALGNRGPEAKAAAPALLSGLKDKPCVRGYAASALRDVLAGDVASLAPLLKDKDADVRLNAVEAVGEIGPAAKNLVPTLIAMTGDADAEVAEAAFGALGGIGPVTPDVIPALAKAAETKGQAGRDAAMGALGQIGSGGHAGEVVPVLIKCLKDSESEIRKQAAIQLREIGPPAAEALPALFAALELPDNGSHMWIDNALQKIRPPGPEEVPELIGIFTSRDRDDRWQAVWALGQLREAARPAEPKLLIGVREDWDPLVRWAAAVALGNIRPMSPAAMAALVKASEDRELRVRVAAVNALAEVVWHAGQGSKAAMPVIRRARADDQRDVRLATIPYKWGSSAGTGYPAALVEEYLPLLKDKTAEVRRVAAQAIADFRRTPLLISGTRSPGRPPPPPPPPLPALVAIIPDLIHMLKEDPDPTVRFSAAMILGGFGPEVKEAREIASALIEAMNTKDQMLPFAVASALVAWGPIIPEIVPALVKASTGEAEGVRGLACMALGRIGVRDPAVVPALTRALRDDYISMRCIAADALRDIGPDAKAAAPALIENLKARNNEVPIHAAEALERMDIKDAAIIPAMVRALRDKSFLLKEKAAQVLASLGPAAADAAGALCELIRTDKDALGYARIEAMIALTRTVPPADAVVPTMLGALHDEKPTVRAWAARVLTVIGFGSHGKECVAALKPLLADPEAGSAAYNALRRAQPGDDPEADARKKEDVRGPE